MIIKTRRRRIGNPKALARVLQDILRAEERADSEKEHFWAIGLDTGNVIKYIDLVTLGLIDSNIIHPRETFRVAVMKGVTRIITAHNHPSGQLKPSRADMEIVDKLTQAGEILGIRMIDHLIVTETGYKSISAGSKKYGSMGLS